MRRHLIYLILATVIFSGATFAKADPLPVTVSIAPQKYLLERIGGEAVAVSVLLKPGADPHAYEPTPAQIRALSSAKAWFTIGVSFEEVWLPRIQALPRI